MGEMLSVLILVARVLDALQIPYFVGGSTASSLYGMPRMTRDVDFVADFQERHVEPFVQALEAEFYVDAEMIRDALHHSGSFNVIHLSTMEKADVFVIKPSRRAEAEMAHRRVVRLGEEADAVAVQMAGPEDTILNKLQWYKMGGGISDRQWGDVTGVFKVQAGRLDLDYLRCWATDLGIADLLAQAMEDAGIE